MGTARATAHRPPKPRRSKSDKPVIGWREWVAFPEFGDFSVKAKIDTGARTSALHAWNIRPWIQNGVPVVTFELHPLQRDNRHKVQCTAPIVDQRSIRNSGGHEQVRYVVRTTAVIGTHTMPIEISLTQRDEMGFRMLLGRAAVRGRFLVDPARSFRLSSAVLRSK